MTIKITTEITWRIVEVTAATVGDDATWAVTAESTSARARFGHGATLPAACEDLANKIGNITFTPAIYAEAKQLLEGEQ